LIMCNYVYVCVFIYLFSFSMHTVRFTEGAVHLPQKCDPNENLAESDEINMDGCGFKQH